MKREICPCKGCTPETGRHSECHVGCNKYINWSTNRYEEGKKIYEAKKLDHMIRNVDIDKSKRLNGGKFKAV